MKIAIVYGTLEGQTRKIAERVAKQIGQAGHETVLMDADVNAASDLDGVGAVVLAASVHQRRHPENFEALIAASLAELEKAKTLLLSVSLSAAFPAGLEEAGEYVIEMKMRTGLSPDAELLVAGAIKLDQYDYFAMQVVRHVVLRGHDVDPNVGYHEFTDWDALETGVEAFLQSLG